MWIALAGIGGLVVAAVLWRFARGLVPDERGMAISELPRSRGLATLYATTAGGTAGAAVVTLVLPHRPDVVAFALFAAVSPGLAAIDAVLHRLPFVVTGALVIAATLAFGWDAVLAGEFSALPRAGWASVAAGSFGLLLCLVFPGKFGFGDVVLLAVIGIFAGWVSVAAVWTALFVGFAFAALGAGVARWQAGKAGAYLPLGAFLLAGWWAVFALYATGWIDQPV
ncbi:hypothetical protein GCM10029992_37650 [Glycomyces albus]